MCMYLDYETSYPGTYVQNLLETGLWLVERIWSDSRRKSFSNFS
jgi:hypothetical protein